MNKAINEYTDKLIDIADHYDDFTTSDLQGSIEAAVMQVYNAGKKDAAPELLEALKLVAGNTDRSTGSDYLIHCTIMDKALAAIAKAAGGAE